MPVEVNQAIVITTLCEWLKNSTNEKQNQPHLERAIFRAHCVTGNCYEF